VTSERKIKEVAQEVKEVKDVDVCGTPPARIFKIVDNYFQ
jgi:hypothetical protein